MKRTTLFHITLGNMSITERTDGKYQLKHDKHNSHVMIEPGELQNTLKLLLELQTIIHSKTLESTHVHTFTYNDAGSES